MQNGFAMASNLLHELKLNYNYRLGQPGDMVDEDDENDDDLIVD